MRATLLALTLLIACDDKAPEAAAESPVAASRKDAGTNAAPASESTALMPDPALEVAADAAGIDRKTGGLYWLRGSAIREIQYAISVGAWRLSPGTTGVTVHVGGAPRLAARLELADGDILTRVGELDLTAAPEPRAAFEALTSGDLVRIEYLRDGEPRRLFVRGVITTVRRDVAAEDVFAMALRSSPEPSLERAVLVALDRAALDMHGRSTSWLLARFGLPEDATDIAIDGASVAPVDFAEALGDKAKASTIEISAGAQTKRWKVVPSVIEAADLEKLLRDPRFIFRRAGHGDALEPGVPVEPGEASLVGEEHAMAGLKELGPGRFELQREKLDELMSNPAALAAAARLVPSMKDGVLQGYKLYGIRRGSLPKSFGFKNGDVLTDINGTQLTSIDKVMEAFVGLSSAKDLTVSLERNGKSIDIEVTIVETH